MREKIKNRLKKLERKKTKINQLDGLVESWIAAGKTYMDLSDRERDLYCAYLKTDRGAYERVEAAVAQWHFEKTGEWPVYELERNGPPLSPEEVHKIVESVERELFTGTFLDERNHEQIEKA